MSVVQSAMKDLRKDGYVREAGEMDLASASDAGVVESIISSVRGTFFFFFMFEKNKRFVLFLMRMLLFRWLLIGCRGLLLFILLCPRQREPNVRFLNLELM